jgi:hypothetical protein
VTLPELHAVELVAEKMLPKTEILFDTLRTFAGCCARQERLHQFLATLKNVVLSSNLVSAALLIILWSTVQVCHALPFQYFKSLCKTLQSDFFVGVCQVDARPQHSSVTLRGCVL